MNARDVSALDRRITMWLARYGPPLLRISLGIVFLWFGALKFVPGLSPADELATATISKLTFGIVGPGLSRPMLALWESLIGLGLLTNMYLRATLLLLALQMLGTVTPLILFPAETWKLFPIALTLEGQYIVKNIVLVTAAFVVGATVRGGAMIASGPIAARARRDELADASEHAATHASE